MTDLAWADKVENSGATAAGRLAASEANELPDVILTKQNKIGAVIWNAGVPGAGVGVDGQVCIDTTNGRVYVPKSGGTWSTYINLSIGLSAYQDWVARGAPGGGGGTTFTDFMNSLRGVDGVSPQEFYVTTFPLPGQGVVGAKYYKVAVIP